MNRKKLARVGPGTRTVITRSPAWTGKPVKSSKKTKSVTRSADTPIRSLMTSFEVFPGMVGKIKTKKGNRSRGAKWAPWGVRVCDLKKGATFVVIENHKGGSVLTVVTEDGQPLHAYFHPGSWEPQNS